MQTLRRSYNIVSLVSLQTLQTDVDTVETKDTVYRTLSFVICYWQIESDLMVKSLPFLHLAPWIKLRQSEMLAPLLRWTPHNILSSQPVLSTASF